MNQHRDLAAGKRELRFGLAPYGRIAAPRLFELGLVDRITEFRNKSLQRALALSAAT
jgi:hypothetical protein